MSVYPSLNFLSRRTSLVLAAIGVAGTAWSAPLGAVEAPKKLPSTVEAEVLRLLRHPGLQAGHVGLSIVALGWASGPRQFPSAPYNGKARPALLEVQPAKRFLPASNMKLFTAAWVLSRLGPEFRFQTTVTRGGAALGGPGAPVNPSTARALTLQTSGDPSLVTADLEALAQRVVNRVPGPFAVEHTPTQGMHGEHQAGRYPEGWTLDDADWGYGPSVVCGTVNRNRFSVGLVAGPQPGGESNLVTLVSAPFKIDNQVETVAQNPRGLSFDFVPRGGGDPVLVVSGSLLVGEKKAEAVSVPYPEKWLLQLFRDGLAKAAEPAQGRELGAVEFGVLAAHESAPLSLLLKNFLKPSDNLYGELLLRRAALDLPATGAESGGGSSASGSRISSVGLAGRAHAAMAQWLQVNGVPIRDVRFSDGSGLSRYNMLTPVAVTGLLRLAEEMPHGKVFYDALPVAGVDGTLRRRMLGTAAEGNARAKTGTFSIANCLSGYVTTRDGHRLAVAMLTDFVPDGEVARSIQGRIFATLAASTLSGPKG